MDTSRIRYYVYSGNHRCINALRITKLDFGSVAGMMCGSMANPMALNYANDTIPGDNPAVSYATVYPLCMFLRVIIAQVILMFFI